MSYFFPVSPSVSQCLSVMYYFFPVSLSVSQKCTIFSQCLLVMSPSDISQHLLSLLSSSSSFFLSFPPLFPPLFFLSFSLLLSLYYFLAEMYYFFLKMYYFFPEMYYFFPEMYYFFAKMYYKSGIFSPTPRLFLMYVYNTYVLRRNQTIAVRHQDIALVVPEGDLVNSDILKTTFYGFVIKNQA